MSCEIKVSIKISYLPGLEPYPGYYNIFYSEYELYEKPSIPVIALTSQKWTSNLNLDHFNQKIQSSTSQRFELKFPTTESIGIELIERAGVIEIKEANKEAYKAYNISLTPEYSRDTNTYIYTLQFTKDNERNFIDYAASDNVEAWQGLSSSNYANKLVFKCRNTPYTQRSAGVNDTVATFDYNIKFKLNEETSQISVADKFYVTGGAPRSALDNQDYRCSVVYIDTDYIYFKYDGIPIDVFDETELTISGEPDGNGYLIATPTANEFDGEIYTFFKTKLASEFDLSNATEQIPGIQTYSNQKFKDNRKVLVFLKPEQNYLYQKLLMCDPKDVYFSELDYQGSETKYYPVTMVDFITQVAAASLRDLGQFEVNLQFNNTVVNVNRSTV